MVRVIVSGGGSPVYLCCGYSKTGFGVISSQRGGWSSVSVFGVVIGSNGQGHRVPGGGGCPVSVLGVVKKRQEVTVIVSQARGFSVSISGMVILSQVQGHRVLGEGTSMSVSGGASVSV